MSLAPLQRTLIETTLGVKPRRKGLHLASKDEKVDKKIGGALDDYERREEKVLEAIKELASVPATGPLVVELEGKVAGVRRTVETVGRETAAKGIDQAYEKLEAIKEEARAAAKLAAANQGFYNLLQVGETEVQALTQNPHFGLVQDRVPAIRQSLLDARASAKGGDFADAKKQLDVANSASLTAATDMNRFGTDLEVFNRDALVGEGLLSSLDLHPGKHSGAGDIGTAKSSLDAARQDAATFDLPAARLKLADVGPSMVLAKAAADKVVTDLIDKAELDLANVLAGSDTAVSKAMAEEIRLIGEKLVQARALVPTDAVQADRLLDEASLATIMAGTNRDQALSDVNKLRADAKLTDAALKLLEAHPQKAHVAAEVQTATLRVASARTETGEGRLGPARLLQTQADTAAAAAKDLADKYAAFLVKYAEGIRFCNGLKKNFPSWNDPNPVLLLLEAAKTKAGTQRKYTEAETDVTNALQPLKARKDELKTASLSNQATAIADLETSLLTIVPAKQTKKPGTDASALDLLDADPNGALVEEMKKLRAMKAQIEAYAEAGDWYEVSAQKILFGRLVTSVQKVAKRRGEYNTDRALTVTAIQGLAVHKSLVGHMMSLNALVARADKLATSKDMRFEDGREQLADIRNTCTMLAEIGKAADTYIKERAEADTAYEELEKAA